MEKHAEEWEEKNWKIITNKFGGFEKNTYICKVIIKQNTMTREEFNLFVNCIKAEVRKDLKKHLPKHVEPVISVTFLEGKPNPLIKTALVCMN